MAITAAWLIIAWGLTSLTIQRHLARFFFWYIDRMDRIFNPWTRDRVRAHNELLAAHRRKVAAKNERE